MFHSAREFFAKKEVGNGSLNRCLQGSLASFNGFLPEGGLPMGALSEWAGPLSSGKRSLALSFCLGAHLKFERKRVVWLDGSCSFYPLGALESGGDWFDCLRSMTVIRPMAWQKAPSAEASWSSIFKAAEILLEQGASISLLVIDLGYCSQSISSHRLIRLQRLAARSEVTVLFLRDNEPLLGRARKLAEHSLGSAISLKIRFSATSHGLAEATIVKSKKGGFAQSCQLKVSDYGENLLHFHPTL